MIQIDKAIEMLETTEASEIIPDPLAVVISELRMLIPVSECKQVIVDAVSVWSYNPNETKTEFILPKLELVCKYANESTIYLLARCGVYYDEFTGSLYISQKL